MVTMQGIGLRLLFSVILVFSTYNPSTYSYFHWVRGSLADFPNVPVVMVFAGVVLLIGWTMFLRATLRSLGAFGLTLAIAFFGSLLWMVVDFGLVPADSVQAISYLILVALSGVLGAGMSWSHIRRRASGQTDVDDVEDG